MSKRRTCRRCGSRRVASKFTLRPPRRGAHGWCDPCVQEFNRDWNLRKRYGITAEDYDEMHEAQGGKCMCCGDEVSDYGRGSRLHVDHCHETGAVRGLLCQRCNLLIGHADECTDRLRSAVEYLEAA